MQKLILALFLVLFPGICLISAPAKTDVKRARHLTLHELNILRLRSKQKIKQTLSVRKSVSLQEVEKVLCSLPSESSLAKALEFRKNLNKFYPSLEEFIINCYWQLGKKEMAVSQARALLNVHEAKMAHKILFYHSLAANELEAAGFHFFRANFRGFNWLINFFHLYLKKLYLKPAITILGLLLITIIIVGVRFIFAAMQKRPQQLVSSPIKLSPTKKSKSSKIALKLPPILGLVQEKRKITFSSLFGLQNYKSPPSFEFFLFMPPKKLEIKSLLELPNKIAFAPTKFFCLINSDEETNRSNVDSITSETVQKQSDNLYAKQDSSFGFINSSKICLPAIEFNHFDDFQTEETTKAVAPILERLASIKEKVAGITSTREIDNRVGFAFILGIALARLEKKVLIIDADFAKPMLNLFTDTPCIYGLKDLLTNTNVNCRVDFPTQVENLSIVVSGTPDSNTQAKMSAEFWQLVIKMFKRKYDFIIIVLPQLLKLSDLQLQDQSMIFLTLMDGDSENLVNEYFFSKISLSKYNVNLFQAINVIQKSLPSHYSW